MCFQSLPLKVTRVRQTSNMMFSAAAIAVVSEVNPDEPGASSFPLLYFLFLIIIFFICAPRTAQANATQSNRNALATANYNNTLIQITPMLFHHIELGMTYETVKDIVGKSPLYCDSGKSICNAENDSINKKCIEREFITSNESWYCHWDGVRKYSNIPTRLDVWFVGDRVSQIAATMPDGNIYRRDSGNTVYLQRH